MSGIRNKGSGLSQLQMGNNLAFIALISFVALALSISGLEAAQNEGVNEYLEALAQNRVFRVWVIDLPSGGAKWRWEEKVAKPGATEETVEKELPYISNETRERWLSVLEQRIQAGQKIVIERDREEVQGIAWWQIVFIVTAALLGVGIFITIVSRAQFTPLKKFGKAVARMHRIKPIVKTARRMMQSQNKLVKVLGRFLARIFEPDIPKVTFNDVGGVHGARKELEEIVDFLKHPKKYKAVGAKLPRGVLLVSPPGYGKTLLAKAIAGEAGVPFFATSAARFEEMLIGVGASRVQDLFKKAKKNAPCIIFIDEIDAVGRQRGVKLLGSQGPDAINQLLIEMDGFDPNTGIIVIAATNRPDILDPALLRPGRFDRKIVLDRVNTRDRREILEIHAREKPLAEDVILDIVARKTPGFSGADLANMMNEAALLAVRRGKSKITMSEIWEAIQRLIAGPPRERNGNTEMEDCIAAFHEGGHALVAKLIPIADKPDIVTILPRGRFYGYMLAMPSGDKQNLTRAELTAKIKVGLGGRAAEELIFGKKGITIGGQQDFEVVTGLALQMTKLFGMSKAVGPISFKHSAGEEYLHAGQGKPFGEEMMEMADKEVREIIHGNFRKTKDELLSPHMKELQRLAFALFMKKALEGEEIDRAIAGELYSDDQMQDWMAKTVEPIKQTLGRV